MNLGEDHVSSPSHLQSIIVITMIIIVTVMMIKMVLVPGKDTLIKRWKHT